MTDDPSSLDNLRPEVRKLIEAVKAECQPFGWATIIAELLRLRSTESRANEWQLRAERAEADLATAQDTINAQQDTMGALKRKLAIAEAELEALKARIRGACLVPLTAVMLRNGYSLTVSGPMSVNDVDELAGKCVRLVVEESGKHPLVQGW